MKDEVKEEENIQGEETQKLDEQPEVVGIAVDDVISPPISQESQIRVEKTTDEIENEIIDDLLSSSPAASSPTTATPVVSPSVENPPAESDDFFDSYVKEAMNDGEKCKSGCFNTCMDLKTETSILKCINNCGCEADADQLLQIQSDLKSAARIDRQRNFRIFFFIVLFMTGVAGLIFLLHLRGDFDSDWDSKRDKEIEDQELGAEGYERLD